MWELYHKVGWMLKNGCFWTVVLEKILESPLHCKEIQPVHPKGNQSWILIGRTDAEADAPILWPPDAKLWLTRKDPDAGKDWGQEEKGTTEDEMVALHHWLNRHEFEQATGDGKGQGSLACCSPWGYKKSDMTEWLNSSKYMYYANVYRIYIIIIIILIYWALPGSRQYAKYLTCIIWFNLQNNPPR